MTWHLAVKVELHAKVSLRRSPGVFTPLLSDCKPEFWINNSACRGSASSSMRSGAFPDGGTLHRSTRLGNRTSHESRSCGRGPQCRCVLHEYMFAQLFLEFSNLSPRCKRPKVVAVSEHTDVFDCMCVQARIEHIQCGNPVAPQSVRSADKKH